MRMIRQAMTMIASAAIVLATPVLAQDEYPSQPIRMIVPLGAGGPTDTAGRLFARALGDVLGQPVVVENISGASSVVGTQEAVDSRPDGYTLLFGSSSTFAVNPAVIANLPFDVEEDLEFVGLVSETPHALVVNADVPARTFEELIALAKEKPGEMNYASTGQGGNIHMSTELFKHEAGVDIAAIPYKGGGEGVMAVVTGEVDVFVNDLGTTIEHIKAGSLRPLAMFGADRSPLLPDVPTTAELGFPGIVSSSWSGLAVPAGTPEAIVARLRAAMVEANADEEYKAGLAAINNRQITAEFMAREREKWGTVAEAASVEVEL